MDPFVEITPTPVPVSFWKKRSHQIGLVIGIALALVAIVAGLALYFPSIFSKLGIPPLVIQQDDSFSDLRGTLSFSLKKMGDNQSPVTLYWFDIGKKTLSPGSFADLAISNKFSADGTQMAVAQYATATISTAPVMQIYVLNLQNGTTKAVSKNNLKYKREPVWSSDGKQVAYVAFGTGDASLPESWHVYLSDLSGREREVTKGYNPIFSPDGLSLLVMKNDGIYLYDLASGKSNLVLGPENTGGGNMNTLMKLSLSRKGDALAISNFGQTSLNLFEISSWKPFAASVQQHLAIPAVWTVFSPDGKYLAVETGDKAGKILNDPYIGVYNLETFASKIILPLGDFDLTKFWLSDWR